MEYNLFENIRADASGLDPMAEGAVLLRGKVLAFEYDLLHALRRITEQAPFGIRSCRAGSQCRSL
jgi:hypothetical protein